MYRNEKIYTFKKRIPAENRNNRKNTQVRMYQVKFGCKNQKMNKIFPPLKRKNIKQTRKNYPLKKGKKRPQKITPETNIVDFGFSKCASNIEYKPVDEHKKPLHLKQS